MLVVIRTKLVGRHQSGTGGLPERAETLVTPWNLTVGGTGIVAPGVGKDEQNEPLASTRTRIGRNRMWGIESEATRTRGSP